jgi:putative nucleotidyltransferase with HDIG domain
VKAVAPEPGVSLAEVIGVLSLGIDLGLGLPMEHVLGSCAIGVGLAERATLSPAETELVYLTSLLAWVGCHADSHEAVHWLGDDIAARHSLYAIDQTPLKKRLAFAEQLASSDQRPLTKARRAADMLVGGRQALVDMRTDHCRLAGHMATRLGLRDDLGAALMQVYERWDGRGDPGAVRGDAITRAVRVFHLAKPIEVYHRASGLEATVEMVRARRGTEFDPDLADLFCAHAPEVLAPLDSGASWDVVMSRPPLNTPLSPERATVALEAVADFVDLKSPYTLGHSRAVADLAAEAARLMGLAADDVESVRRAGLLHDLGRLGISNAIWDKQEPLSASEREHIRLQPYLTERILACSPTLGPLAPVASAHQERVDGSGYPRGLRGDALPATAKILAAADVYQATTEPRAYRDARSPDDAATQLRDEVRAGRLDAAAADAVLQAAGHKATRRPAQPAGLTARELEVLKLLARGHKNKRIAEELVISPRTVGHHISHIYLKIGASSRVGASLYATEHGLLGPNVP